MTDTITAADAHALRKAQQHRASAAEYRRTAERYMRVRGDWAFSQVEKYWRMAEACDVRADAYQCSDAEAIARIEAEDAALDALLTEGRRE